METLESELLRILPYNSGEKGNVRRYFMKAPVTGLDAMRILTIKAGAGKLCVSHCLDFLSTNPSLRTPAVIPIIVMGQACHLCLPVLEEDWATGQNRLSLYKACLRFPNFFSWLIVGPD